MSMSYSHKIDHFLPYGKQTISEADIEAVVRVLRSPYLTQGPAVPAFERALSHYTGANFAIAVNSATSALHIACLALGLGTGDFLWTSPITFVASANCARYCGANVDFVDIDPATGLMSVDALQEKLKAAKENGCLPKVVIPVHLCGTSCNMKAISILGEEYGFKIIEDASHASGGSYLDHNVGSCRYSSISIFSFHPVKIITTGEGGMALTNDSLLSQKMADLRSHGITKDETRFLRPAIGPWSYEQHELGYNYRMSDLQAALGLSQFDRLDEFVNKRNLLFNNYLELFSLLPITFLSIPEYVKSSLHLAVIRLNNPSPSLHKYVFEGLRASGIGVQLHYLPVHLQPYYRQLGFSDGYAPLAEAYSHSAISVPLYPDLTYDEQVYIRDTFKSLLSSY